MEPDLSLQVEAFLRNALRQRKLEDRLVRQALRDLRLTLAGIERVIGGSGVLAMGPAREENIRRLVAAVSRSVQESFSGPQLAALQEALTPFVQAQLDFARQMVQRAGGSLTAEGAVQLTPMQASRLINQQVVAGKTLEAQLTQALPALVADRVERYIRLGLSDVGGETFATYKDAVVRITEGNVEAIIRTGTHEAGSAAQQLIYQFETDPDWMGPDGLVWTAVLDSRTCPVCLKLDGKRYPPDYRKVSPHPQCVLGDTLIEPGILAAATRSTYSGNIVTINTHGGRRLAVTENHPVLTSNGWKPAKLINEGDQLVCRLAEDSETPVNPDLDQCPPTAEQLFALLSHEPAVGLSGVPAAPVDFHGDGAGMHGDVDIACVNRELLLYGQSMCAEHLREALFVVADMQLTLVDELSATDQLLLAAHAAASGLVGSRDLMAALLGGHLAPLEGLRLALAARRDPGFDEPPANSAASDAKPLCDLFLAQSGAIELDDVGQVQIEAQHGVPVYDFSTLSGAYFAGGILIHNCRCYLVPWKWRNQDMTNPAGEKVPPKRPANGDGAEEALSFKVAAKTWVKQNPETAQAIFGKKLGQDLIDGKVSFDQAVKRWQAPKAT